MNTIETIATVKEGKRTFYPVTRFQRKNTYNSRGRQNKEIPAGQLINLRR